MKLYMLIIFRRLIYRLRILIKEFVFVVRPGSKQVVIDNFHKLYYDSFLTGKTWKKSEFLGVPIYKCPLDLFIYQEILFSLKPDVIVETGTAAGGGALYLASICDLLGQGRVITVDIKNFVIGAKHPRVTYMVGSSVSEGIYNKIVNLVDKKDKVLVILDSDHSMNHVLREMKLYSKLVSTGSYLIVEDTNINGNPVYAGYGEGPNEAVKKFLEEDSKFVIDKTCEKFYLTFNPNGYLKKVSS